jgi:hypothetical protein
MQLHEAIELPANACCHLAEWTGVVSWESISESNRNLYVGESVGGISSYRVVQLPRGAHDSESLRAVLQDSLNASRPSGLGVYSVVRSSSASASTSANVGSAAFRFYSVSVNAGAFCIISDVLLESPSWNVSVWRAGGGPAYDVTSPKSTNELFQFQDQLSFQTSHVSKFIDLRSKHSLFLHSNIGNNDSVGPNGLRSILGKIPISASYGSVLHYQHSGSPYDLVSCGPSTLNFPRFWIRDARNQPVDLLGGHWSCTLVFSVM